MSGREAVAEDAAGILDRAAARGIAGGVPYAGLVTPDEAWRLHRAGAAAIIDVRTRPEYEYVGRVPDSILVEWRRYDEARPNPDFPFARLVEIVYRRDPTRAELARMAELDGLARQWRIQAKRALLS